MKKMCKHFHLQASLADPTTSCKEKALSHKYMSERPHKYRPLCISHGRALSGKCILCRILQQNWFWKHTNVITCSLFCKLFIGNRSNPEQTTSCRLSQPLLWLISLFLWPSHCVHPFQAATFSCRHTDTLYFVSPMLEQKILANAMPPAVLKSIGISPHSLLHSFCVQVWVCVCVCVCVHACVRVCGCCVRGIQHDHIIIIFEVLTYTLLLLLWSPAWSPLLPR